MSEPKSIFDSSDLDAIDAKINEELSRGTLIDQMQESSEKREARKMDWASEFREYWYIYTFVLISGLFTLTLGVYLGLDPYKKVDASGSSFIYWHTDWGHVLMAIIIATALLTVTELAFVVGKLRFQHREDGNATQRITSWWVMAIGAVSLLVTGIAGFRVVASNIAMLTEFREIPRSAQLWISVAIPLLITIHLVLLTAYANSSAHAKAKRLARENKRKQDLDQETRMNIVEQMANRAFQIQEIKAFERAVMRGMLTASQAAAARRAGKTLQQLEREMGQDLDEDGEIGNELPAPRPGIWLPEEEYRRVAQKYPNVPGTFIPDSEEEFQEIKRQNGATDPTKRQSPRN